MPGLLGHPTLESCFLLCRLFYDPVILHIISTRSSVSKSPCGSGELAYHLIDFALSLLTAYAR